MVQKAFIFCGLGSRAELGTGTEASISPWEDRTGLCSNGSQWDLEASRIPQTCVLFVAPPLTCQGALGRLLSCWTVLNSFPGGFVVRNSMRSWNVLSTMPGTWQAPSKCWRLLSENRTGCLPRRSIWDWTVVSPCRRLHSAIWMGLGISRSPFKCQLHDDALFLFCQVFKFWAYAWGSQGRTPIW